MGEGGGGGGGGGRRGAGGQRARHADCHPHPASSHQPQTPTHCARYPHKRSAHTPQGQTRPGECAFWGVWAAAAPAAPGRPLPPGRAPPCRLTIGPASARPAGRAECVGAWPGRSGPAVPAGAPRRVLRCRPLAASPGRDARHRRPCVSGQEKGGPVQEKRWLAPRPGRRRLLPRCVALLHTAPSSLPHPATRVHGCAHPPDRALCP